MTRGWMYRTPAELRALPHSGSPTSAAAAERVVPETARVQRALVLHRLSNRPMTDEEIQASTGLDGDAERPRRWQLVRNGLVRDSGRKRKTSSGADAIVWELVE